VISTLCESVLTQTSVAYYIPRLYGLAILLLGYKPVQHVTVLNIFGKCNTMIL